jgi:MYXO-CTERM domain-containing protein
MTLKFKLLSTLLMSAVAATSGSASAATVFNGTLTASEIVGSTPIASGSGSVAATLSGGPGSWKFSFVGDFYNYDFGAYLLPFVQGSPNPPNGTNTPSETTVALGDNTLNFHIHVGARGATGPVAYSVRQPDRENGTEPVIQILSPTHARIVGSWDLNDGEIGGSNPLTQQGNLAHWAPIMAAAQPGDEIDLYFDIHTNAYTGSEIRGQMIAVPEPSSALLALVGVAGFALRSRRR